jgi:hypothetical protein
VRRSVSDATLAVTTLVTPPNHVVIAHLVTWVKPSALVQKHGWRVSSATKDTTKNKLVNRSVCHAFLENINQKKERSNVKIVGKIRSQKTLHKQPANILVLDLLS